jgi:archaetidylinositol phosphate synthase
MSSSPIEPVERIQRNLLAVGERRLLTWLSARLPRWVTPDKLTSLGFIGAVLVGAGYALSALNPAWLWLSIVSFFINWFGDSLDGSLARFRHIERPRYGYFIDHSMDAIGNLIIMIGIGVSPFVRMDVALIGLAVYFLLSIHTFLSAKVAGEFNLTYLAGGPTELRLILIAMSLAMFWGGAIPAGDSIFTVFDVFILVLASILMVVFLVQTAAMAARLRRLGQ